MKKMQVALSDSKGQKEIFETSVIGGADFSAKVLRKALQKHIVALVTLNVKHGVNRGCKIGVNVQFDGLNTTLKPIYFGGYKPGERADQSLKAQLAVLVLDIKELAG
jgi:hypothetical protein